MGQFRTGKKPCINRNLVICELVITGVDCTYIQSDLADTELLESAELFDTIRVAATKSSTSTNHLLSTRPTLLCQLINIQLSTCTCMWETLQPPCSLGIMETQTAMETGWWSGHLNWAWAWSSTWKNPAPSTLHAGIKTIYLTCAGSPDTMTNHYKQLYRY